MRSIYRSVCSTYWGSKSLYPHSCLITVCSSLDGMRLLSHFLAKVVVFLIYFCLEIAIKVLSAFSGVASLLTTNIKFKKMLKISSKHILLLFSPKFSDYFSFHSQISKRLCNLFPQCEVLLLVQRSQL